MEGKTPEIKEGTSENKAVENKEQIKSAVVDSQKNTPNNKGEDFGGNQKKEENISPGMLGGLNLGNINVEKLKEIWEIVKKYLLIVKDFFIDKEHEKTIIVSLAVVSIIGLGYSIFHLISQLSTLEKNVPNLEKLENYNIQSLKENQLTSNLTNNVNVIGDLININSNITNEISRFDEHKKELQSSYTNFFQYFLVPNLNIRKEPYTNNINLNIIGKEFLGNNPFSEINLYQKWSNFFSNTEKNQINTIKELEIGEITEAEFGLYSIKISFSFSTPSKNALLFLADKISMTSDKENIALLGEFIYYLWQQIKTDKADVITKLKDSEENKDLGGDIDKVIGKSIYQRITNDKPTELIDEKLINKTVKNIMGCSSDSDSSCFYKFRDKYRNIAELAYSIGATNNSNKIEDLKQFFKNMPPLIAVTKFNFNKVVSKDILSQSVSYEGVVALEIYGQNIKAEEIQQIGKELGKKCFGVEEELTPALAMSKIEATGVSNNGFDDNGKADLKTILENIQTAYETATNYKKTIRLFEIYRMLNEAGYCTAI